MRHPRDPAGTADLFCKFVLFRWLLRANAPESINNSAFRLKARDKR